MRQLRLYNGRWGRSSHAYIAAYSVADAIRVCDELGVRMTRSEIDEYWSHGCWGNAMAGITPERGLWVQKERFGSKPERITTVNQAKGSYW